MKWFYKMLKFYFHIHVIPLCFLEENNCQDQCSLCGSKLFFKSSLIRPVHSKLTYVAPTVYWALWSRGTQPQRNQIKPLSSPSPPLSGGTDKPTNKFYRYICKMPDGECSKKTKKKNQVKKSRASETQWVKYYFMSWSHGLAFWNRWSHGKTNR